VIAAALVIPKALDHLFRLKDIALPIAIRSPFVLGSHLDQVAQKLPDSASRHKSKLLKNKHQEWHYDCRTNKKVHFPGGEYETTHGPRTFSTVGFVFACRLQQVQQRTFGQRSAECHNNTQR
jgi:hypothetical protein